MATLSQAQAISELWYNLGNLQCNWTATTDLEQYFNRAVRERGVSWPLTDTADIRAVPILAEIYALEYLYNRAINNTRVTMGGKTIELQQITEHLKDKIDRLWDLLNQEDGPLGQTIKPMSTMVTMDPVPRANVVKRDVRSSERYEG